MHSPKTRICALLALVCTVALLPTAALAADRALQYVALPQGSYSAAAKSVPSGGYAENQWVQGTNPFTGLPWEGIYLPVMVNIDTDPLARPNLGVYDADVIYELPLHRQGHTRSVALFLSNIPLQAGPVRSARIPMLEIREEFQAGYVFYGTQEYKGVAVKEYLRNIHRELWDKNSFIYPLVDGLVARYANYFDSMRGYVGPHNKAIRLLEIHNAAAKDAPAMRPWNFSDAGLDHGAGVYYISMETRPDFIPSYRYNEATRSYDRYYNGEPFIDGNNGAQCSYANVLILRTAVSWYRNRPDAPLVPVTGQGDADIFMNGRYIRGTWVRAVDKKGDAAKDIAARTVILDDQGQELALLPGKTFIHYIDMATEVAVGIDPSEGTAIQGATAVVTPAPTDTPKPTRTPRPTRTPKPDAPIAAEETPAPFVPEEGDESFGG
ncbi:MAG: DUF3048 domain-containing protein [Oscillospiraceae bacterium]|jgi:hypothetical protein|nr:DUF3048 domain-containing protein [Oscillospiraceae bacterium]